ncbi:MAG: hypothetical protein BGO81_10390 [Devosia sp. 66-22]|nr:MAG: hypothetical protein BGO81_10390 [Devosia sp. 66-22]
MVFGIAAAILLAVFSNTARGHWWGTFVAGALSGGIGVFTALERRAEVIRLDAEHEQRQAEWRREDALDAARREALAARQKTETHHPGRDLELVALWARQRAEELEREEAQEDAERRALERDS